MWTSPAANQKGYGKIFVDGRQTRVHRYAWERVNGRIPEGMMVDHRFHCDRRCVEVSHLRLARNAENVAHRRGANSTSQTGVRNVSKRGNRYYVTVVHRGVAHYRSALTLEEAKKLASNLRAQLFGSFAGRG